MAMMSATTIAASVGNVPITSTLGYSNGILYFEHDAIAEIEHYNNKNNNTNNYNNRNSKKVNAIVKEHDGIEDDEVVDDATQDVAADGVYSKADRVVNNIGDKSNNYKNINCNYKYNFNHNTNNADDIDDDDDTNSFASMETLSDNVSIWVDGEKHWISGVDANTTCADLIYALLSYQDGQQEEKQLGQQQHQQQQQKEGEKQKLEQMFNGASIQTVSNANNIVEGKVSNSTTNNNSNEGKNNTNNGNNAINQSTTNTKENYCKNSSNTLPTTATMATTPLTMTSQPLPLHLFTEYVIVKQHRHRQCEEYLDGSAKVFDVLPARDMPGIRKECELLLRHLPSPPPNTKVASLLSTDKDSGMGSPVGSSRSAKFRRRKYKSSNWLAHGNTLHPKLSQRKVNNNNNNNNNHNNNNSNNKCSIDSIPNNKDSNNNSDNSAKERLMKIILAQDETIHRQLTLLSEKERQISKIEEEKHRVRERELGKNYLLETYLKGLDEVATATATAASTAAVGCNELDSEDGVEIFIDEPYQRFPAASMTATEKPMATSTATVKRKTQKILHKKQRQEQRKDTNTTNSCQYNGITAMATKTVKIPIDERTARNGAYQSATTNNTNNNNNTMIANVNTQSTLATQTSHSNSQSSSLQSTTAPGISSQEIELQIEWLEKVYAINKQLQREEEQLLKLHAKIRKHQVRHVDQARREVLQQIDELDGALVLKCADSYRLDDDLVAAEEQLQQKFCILEKLLQEEKDEVGEEKETKLQDQQDRGETIAVISTAVEGMEQHNSIPCQLQQTQQVSPHTSSTLAKSTQPLILNTFKETVQPIKATEEAVQSVNAVEVNVLPFNAAEVSLNATKHATQQQPLHKVVEDACNFSKSSNNNRQNNNQDQNSNKSNNNRQPLIAKPVVAVAATTKHATTTISDETISKTTISAATGTTTTKSITSTTLSTLKGIAAAKVAAMDALGALTTTTSTSIAQQEPIATAATLKSTVPATAICTSMQTTWHEQAPQIATRQMPHYNNNYPISCINQSKGKNNNNNNIANINFEKPTTFNMNNNYNADNHNSINAPHAQLPQTPLSQQPLPLSVPLSMPLPIQPLLPTPILLCNGIEPAAISLETAAPALPPLSSIQPVLQASMLHVNNVSNIKQQHNQHQTLSIPCTNFLNQALLPISHSYSNSSSSSNVGSTNGIIASNTNLTNCCFNSNIITDKHHGNQYQSQPQQQQQQQFQLPHHQQQQQLPQPLISNYVTPQTFTPLNTTNFDISQLGTLV